jgi:hypothetical protein
MIPTKATRENLIELGFKPLPHQTITGGVIYDLGRTRELNAGSLGTGNEMLTISDHNPTAAEVNIIVLHNFDYDGPLYLEKVKAIIEAISCNNLNQQKQ